MIEDFTLVFERGQTVAVDLAILEGDELGIVLLHLQVPLDPLEVLGHAPETGIAMEYHAFVRAIFLQAVSADAGDTVLLVEPVLVEDHAQGPRRDLAAVSVAAVDVPWDWTQSHAHRQAGVDLALPAHAEGVAINDLGRGEILVVVAQGRAIDVGIHGHVHGELEVISGEFDLAIKPRVGGLLGEHRPLPHHAFAQGEGVGAVVITDDHRFSKRLAPRFRARRWPVAERIMAEPIDLTLDRRIIGQRIESLGGRIEDA